ncbi:hypothetical protein [Paremcibacter congregatus]|uniref:hypothetical protein n=1 Tax=Paremcibacter congregatus TaxID=2043170 RepID=UPI003A90C313
MSRQALESFINRQVGGSKALLTLFEPLAARVGSMEYTDMLADPALWSANLAKTGRLLDMDGLMLGLDPEICLKPDAFAIAVDAFSRMVQTEQNYFGCIAAMAGPLTLAEKMLGNADQVAELKSQTVEMAEAYCKNRPDILILREGRALGGAHIGMPHRKAYNTLKNMAAYYSVPLGIYIEDYHQEVIPDLAKLKLPFVFFGADQEGKAPSIAALKDLAPEVDGIGVPLDFNDPEQARQQAKSYMEELQGVNFLFTNLRELDNSTDLEATLALVSDLRSIGS